MKISIAMATYNGEKFVKEQIESFFNQTVLPDELVVSDDNSIDKTLEIVESLKTKAPFDIKIYRNEQNLGYGANFSNALEKTNGDLVFLSDQDDVWYSNKIEYMLNIAEKYPDNFVYMNDALISDSLLNPTKFTKYNQLKSLGREEKGFVMGCCCLIKKEFLKIALPVPSKIAHDNWLVEIAQAINMKHVEIIVLQYYRIHFSNTSLSEANSLKKAKKVNIWLKGTLSAFYKKSNSELEQFYSKQITIVGRLKQIINRFPEKYKDNIYQHINIIEKPLKLIKLRLQLRNENLIKRIQLSFRFFLKEYNKSTRLKDMIRDIIG